MKGRVVCFDLDQLMGLLDEMSAYEFGEMLATELIAFEESGQPVAPTLGEMFFRQRRRTIFGVARHLLVFGFHDCIQVVGEICVTHACTEDLLRRIMAALVARGRLVAHHDDADRLEPIR